MRPNDSKGRVYGGLIIVAIGSLLLADRLGMEFPYWIFGWEVILITIGIYVGARHSFRMGAWIIPIIIGVVFLLNDAFYHFSLRHFVWPVVIIGFGLYSVKNNY